MRYLMILVVAIAFIAGGIMDSRVSAEESGGESGISDKLDTIIAGQKEIKTGIDSLKEEMRILKIRVTQTQ